MKHDYDTRHGGAHDRGGADAYYGRPRNPHKYEGGSYNGPALALSPAEVEAYNHGFDNCHDRKDWG
jgi:hypothetical protein